MIRLGSRRSLFGSAPANVLSRLFSAHVDEATLSPAEFRKKHQINVTNADVNDPALNPFASFDTTPFTDKILSVFEKSGYLAPTSTQAQSWPIALSGRDMVSVAKTGSGKTMGFLVPFVSKILEEGGGAVRKNAKRRVVTKPKLLVLAPTRELCVQIATEAERFAPQIQTVAIYGGASRNTQINRLRESPHIIVATPGRCNDLLEAGELTVDELKGVVLDEADRMLDM
jgi:ATP-dependent RNA helicase DDX5/DBP2